MKIEVSDRRTPKILWGVLLMAVGGLFLAGRFGLVRAPEVWKLWPSVLVVIGANHALARRPGSAAMLALMGLAFFAAEFGWMGLSYPSFWPLLLVAVGVGMVIRVFSREDERRAQGGFP